MYRAYCNGIEFGIDYRTLGSARRAVASYKANFPGCNYYIRKAIRQRISMLTTR